MSVILGNAAATAAIGRAWLDAYNAHDVDALDCRLARGSRLGKYCDLGDRGLGSYR